MAIGESPGKQEDETGLPFVGEAGKLLNKMFAAIKRDESNLYITNVCNWRPPGNRNPSEDELALCRPFIRRHIELISPKIVVIVGGVSLQALTGKSGIMKTRGQWQNLEIGGSNIPAMPLYHPAFLLRRPELKKQAWQDLLTIQNRIAES
jgi:DNA polymerase